MPQIFQVLRCYKCSVFQVHQTKKANKFICKLCGEKQSIKRHYGIGIAKDCRLHVQKLNGIRKDIDELNNTISSSSEELETHDTKGKHENPVESKWSAYVENTETKETEETIYLENNERILEVPKKKYCRQHHSKNVNNTLIVSKSSDSPLIENKSNSVKINSVITRHIDFLNQSDFDNDTPNTKISLSSCKSSNNVENSFHNEFKCNETNHSVLELKNNNIPVSKTSKWTQYINNDPVEEVLESSNNLDFSSSKSLGKEKTNIFSLCDDSEIDSILNI